MPGKRTSYNAAFKLKVIQHVTESQSNRATAEHFGLNEKQVREWKKKQSEMAVRPRSSKRLPGGGRPLIEPNLDNTMIAWFKEQKTDGIAVFSNIDMSVQSEEDDVEVTGMSQALEGVHVTIKQEPEESKDPLPGTSLSDEEDPDVIYVDTETTMKYLTGKMTFEEYSAHLEHQAEIKCEPVDVQDIASDQVVSSTEVADTPSTDVQPERSSEQQKQVKPKPRPSLPRHLQGLMGEANLRFARRDYEEAIKMCMEIIRVAPAAPGPFQTLSMVFEEQGDNTKSLQYALIAAHLQPRDPDEWCKVAEMCLEQGDQAQAIACYDRAIRASNKDPALWMTRCDLLKRAGETKKALDGLVVVLDLLPSHQGEKFLQLARELTKTFHEAGDDEKAFKFMKKAFDVHPNIVTAEDVNVLLDLMLSQCIYDQQIAVLIQHCGVCLQYADDSFLMSDTMQPIENMVTSNKKPTRCDVPSELPVDLRSKLVVSLIHVGFTDCVKDVIAPLLSESADTVGDLYLDIAEAFMEVGQYQEAKPILARLVQSNNYNLAAVWLRNAECLHAVQELPGAVAAYKKVVELAPGHMGARVSLSSIQQQLGQHAEALAVLEPGGAERPDAPKLDASLLLHKCLLYYSQGRTEEFIKNSRELLFSDCKDIITTENITAVIQNRTLKHRILALRHVVGSDLIAELKNMVNITNKDSMIVDEAWDIYLKLCGVLIDKKRFQEFEDISVAILVLPQFMANTQRLEEAEFICLTACLMNSNGPFAYNFIRHFCLQDLYNNRLWNLFCQIITISQDIRHNRFCLRLMLKCPDHQALGILNGHNALIAGTYKHALGEYVAALRNNSKDPLLSLCIGVTFMHLASQKFTRRRNALILQGCAFFNQYLELRGETQESYYNLGRAMHQIGLYHAAAFYYEKALTFPPAIQDDPEEIFDLSCEIAYNLSLIYQNSGAFALASQVVQKYIVV